MELNPISPSNRPAVQERATRGPGESKEAKAPPAPSPSNGMPPPVGDIIEVSNTARSEFAAWEARQGRTGSQRRLAAPAGNSAPAQNAAPEQNSAPAPAPDTASARSPAPTQRTPEEPQS